MATFGISMPDELATELDTIAKQWYTNRSSALTRIFLEWKQSRTTPSETDQPSVPKANERAANQS
jgi:metal-responsive CopG/Arc/MetJ family transcriptional regulator